MSNFAIETYTTKTNKVDLVDAAHINSVQTSIVTIETALNILISQNGSIAQGTSFPGTAVQGQIFWRTDQNLLYVYTGSAWSSVASQQWVPNNIQIFTSSGTWTQPAGVNKVYVKVIGGGGTGGNSSSSTGTGGGGGGGGYAEGIIAVTGNVTVTIGSTNSFAGSSTISSTAGGVGSNGVGSTAGAGGGGGSGSGGTINISGSVGGHGLPTLSGQGGSSCMGAGAQGFFGFGSNAGNAFGGGGSGGGENGSNVSIGGAGDPGAVIIYY